MYQRPLSAQAKSYRINVYNQNKKYENTSYTNNKDLLAYWEKKKKKSNEKIEKIKQELYNKEYGEIRNSPNISPNSKKIVNKILRNKVNNYLNNNNNQIAISMRNFSNYNKFCYTDNNNCFFNKNNNNKIKQKYITTIIKNVNKKVKKKPVTKIEKKRNSIDYQRYEPIKMNNDKNKLNLIFNSKSKEKIDQELNNNYYNFTRNFPNPYVNSYSENNTNKIFALFNNNSVNQKNNSNHNINKMKQKEINFFKNEQKNLKSDINNSNRKNQNISQLKENENKKFINPNIKNKAIEITEIFNKLNFNKNSNYKNQKIFPKSNSSVTINKRNDDLNKFILFANNLYVPKNKNKTKTKKEQISISENKKINMNKNNEFDNFFPKVITKEMILSNEFIINDINNTNFSNIINEK